MTLEGIFRAVLKEMFDGLGCGVITRALGVNADLESIQITLNPCPVRTCVSSNDASML